MQKHRVKCIEIRNNCVKNEKKLPKYLEVTRKSYTFAVEIKSMIVLISLGYGVMVTLQILVLPFLVRVRVSQQKMGLLNE